MTNSIPVPARPSVTNSIAYRWFTILLGITALMIFLQAVTSGEFVSQRGRDFWVEVHGGVADAAWGFALITAIVAVVALRNFDAPLTWGSVALFVTTLAQTVLGHLITDLHQDGWIGVHVPLAFVVFALVIWLSIRAASVRRRHAQSAP